jgi:hypothetical protein
MPGTKPTAQKRQGIKDYPGVTWWQKGLRERSDHKLTAGIYMAPYSTH